MAELNREYLVKEYGIDLIYLAKIDIVSKKFRKIDSNAFNGLTKLEILRLLFNEIEEIKLGSFESLLNLKMLDLTGNELKRINSNLFKGLTKLEELWLSYNKIEEIEFGSFESLSNLRLLYLTGNKLKRINSNVFKSFTKLEKLSLSKNEIEEIEMESFESLLSLEWLFLQNNKLKRIDRKCFEPLESIKKIDISDNDGLNYRSFDKESNNSIKNSLLNIVKKGTVSNWNQFLKQFPESEEAKLFRDPNIGLLLKDRYKVVRKLGKGSFGLVYLVNDTEIEIKYKEKAIKIMDQLDLVTVNELELFMEINHDNIVRYFDHFHLDKQTFLIMEYCENGDLKNKIEETKRLGINFSDKQILDWIRQATNALNYLHSKKPKPIIHRDIKPANMLLNGRNEIKLGDLGLSKIMENTHASTYAGSLPYMSPEVFKSQIMDTKYYPNTDIWSLGCVLYELKFLDIAFPKGQFGDPRIPLNVWTSGPFSNILYEMLGKDCLVRITSRRLLEKLENFSVE